MNIILEIIIILSKIISHKDNAKAEIEYRK